MAVIKNNNTGKWEVRTYYKDIFTGERKQKTKRGFNKKSEAKAWEEAFKLQRDENLDMPMEAFVEIYLADISPKLKENSLMTKRYIIEEKILPYLGKMKLQEIKPSHVMKWQNEIMTHMSAHGRSYSPVYLKTIHNQLSAIFNHTEKMYGLRNNPARQAGNMGKEKNGEMFFWTKEEYLQFIEGVADKPLSYYAFQILYWCGIRCGELLALTAEDFDFEKKTLRINKSYQRIKGKDVITTPKTEKSNRIIVMPDFLNYELKDFLERLYKPDPSDRIFQISKSYLHHEMDRGVKNTGVKRIRIHDLRHSHVSLLINMGYSALAIGDRIGHEAVKITYRYAHLFPTIQTDMANKLNQEMEEAFYVGKE